MRNLKTFLHDDSGATAIEYALIVTFIALAIIASLVLVGNNLKKPLGTVASNLK